MRLFVAFEVPAAVGEAVGRRLAAERAGLPPARWVDPRSLHLTLVFLGAVDAAAVAPLEAALAPAFAAHPPLTLRLAGAGCFPPATGARPRPARVAWLGVEVAEGDERLRAVQATVERAVRRVVELPPGEHRPYAPHLTLARPRPPWPAAAATAFAAAFAPSLGGDFRVAEGVLVSSEPGRGAGGGSLYRALGRYRLAAAGEAVA